MRYGYLIVSDCINYDIITVKVCKSIRKNTGSYIEYKLLDATTNSGEAQAGVELFATEIEAEEKVKEIEMQNKWI